MHVQVLSNTTDQIVAEAERLHALPFDIVVKIPAHAAGLAAIKRLKQLDIPVLATAIYNVQQGVLAAMNGADYLAPYLNRIDNLGCDGLGVVADLQQFVERYQLPTKLLVASFKNVRQVLEVLKLGVHSATLPPDIADKCCRCRRPMPPSISSSRIGARLSPKSCRSRLEAKLG